MNSQKKAPTVRKEPNCGRCRLLIRGMNQHSGMNAWSIIMIEARNAISYSGYRGMIKTRHGQTMLTQEKLMHYYQFNIGDYHSHTSHLDPLEDIAYRRMLDWCYLHEASLPESVDEIARSIRMQKHCNCIALVLQEFFTLTESGYVSERCVKEIKKVNKVSRERKKAAKARWANKDVALKGDANAMQVHTKSNATHNPLPKTHNPLPIKKKKSTRSTAIEDDLNNRDWAN